MEIDKSLGITIVPRLYLIKDSASDIKEMTSKAFAFASPKERQMLFSARATLADILPSDCTDSLTADQYITALEKMHKYLPDNCNMPFPGVLPLYMYSHSEISRILGIGNNITLYCTDIQSCDCATNFLKFTTKSNTAINIILKRNPPEEIINSIYELWASGVSVSITNEYSARNIISRTTGNNIDTFDVIKGVPIQCGRSAVKFASINLADNTKAKDKLFNDILKQLMSLLREEVQARFRSNNNGKLVYKNNRETDDLTPYIAFYDKCISNTDKVVRGILYGGAEYDYLCVTTEHPSDLPYLAAACKYCESLYPIKALPYYTDRQEAEKTDDIYDIIRNHSSIANTVYGGSSLEIKIPYITQNEFGKIVATFLATHGVNIKIIKQE